MQYEKQYSKDEILTQYLNTVYFGANAYGAEAAAQTYFGKTPSESDPSPRRPCSPACPRRRAPITRAGIPTRPSSGATRCSAPCGSRATSTGSSTTRPYDTPIKLAPYSPYQQVREPYVVDFVKQQLIAMFGKDKVFKGGLRVQTTIDPKCQELARKAIKGVLNQKNDPSAAIVSLDPNTGYIRAMASSGDYDKTKFNLAAQMHRQPGSAFKPFCLVAALEQGMNPVTTVYRSGPQAIHIPGANETWHVNNFSDGYYGSSNLVEATIHSDNSIFAQLIMDVGVQERGERGQGDGHQVADQRQPEPSCSAGSPMGSARSTWPPLTGRWRPAVGTWSRRSSRGSGTRAASSSARPSRRSRRRSRPRTAFTATQILELNVQRGTGKRAHIGRPGAGKTGTASDFSDAWFCGYTPHLATAVWVGHPKGRVPMRSVHGIAVTGGSFPAMIWHNFMYEADRTYPAGGFPGPSGIAAAGGPVVAGAGSTTTDSTTTTTGAGTTRPRRTTTTAAPTTSKPTTSPPTTSPPTTSPPTTSPPTTSPPTTSPPTTQPPTTAAPATATAPTNAVPATVSPPT